MFGATFCYEHSLKPIVLSADNELFPQLNLPPTRLQLKCCADGIMRVHDRLRRKFVALTPEEWVRQHFVAHLIDNLGYPQALLANEVAITLNGTSRRCDTVLYSPQGLRPMAIVEYKATDVAITQKVFDQITRYNTVLQVPWLFVSNGLRHFCCHIDYTTNTLRFLKDLPPYTALTN